MSAESVEFVAESVGGGDCQCAFDSVECEVNLNLQSVWIGLLISIVDMELTVLIHVEHS